jgi:hypothetical protein
MARRGDLWICKSCENTSKYANTVTPGSFIVEPLLPPWTHLLVLAHRRALRRVPALRRPRERSSRLARRSANPRDQAAACMIGRRKIFLTFELPARIQCAGILNKNSVQILPAWPAPK